MHCPKCDTELAPGNVYCPSCGYEVQIVPDYDPLDEVIWEGQEKRQKQKNSQKKDPQKKDSQKRELQNLKEDSDKKRKKKMTVGQRLFHLWRDPLLRKISLLSVLLLICVGAAFGAYFGIRRQSDYGYQLRKGMEYYESQQLEEAIRYLKRAQELQSNTEGADERPLLYLARTYEQLGEYEMASDLLTSLLEFSLEEKEKLAVYEELFQTLQKAGKSGKINGLIEGCKEESIQRRLFSYRIEKPTVSIRGGVYHYYINPQLQAAYGTIYYTLDGSMPTEESTKYDGKISLQEGDNLLTAVAINEEGIVSEQLFEVYTLDFDVPEDTTNKNDSIDYSTM